MSKSMDGSIPSTLIIGGLGTIVGAAGTLILQRILPEPKPGDGFTVRWLDNAGSEKRLDFGKDEKMALEKAVELAAKYAGVEVIEIRQGLVVGIQRAGSAPKVVKPANGLEV